MTLFAFFIAQCVAEIVSQDEANIFGVGIVAEAFIGNVPCQSLD